MKIMLINGANINMLGVREPSIYGSTTYAQLVSEVTAHAKRRGAEITAFQSNSEGAIVDQIHKAYYENYDAIIINAGGYTHTSVAILDALKATNLPTAEVHLSDISTREPFRHFSYISLYAQKIIVGKGINGYIEAIDWAVSAKQPSEIPHYRSE